MVVGRWPTLQMIIVIGLLFSRSGAAMILDIKNINASFII